MVKDSVEAARTGKPSRRERREGPPGPSRSTQSPAKAETPPAGSTPQAAAENRRDATPAPSCAWAPWRAWCPVARLVAPRRHPRCDAGSQSSSRPLRKERHEQTTATTGSRTRRLRDGTSRRGTGRRGHDPALPREGQGRGPISFRLSGDSVQRFRASVSVTCASSSGGTPRATSSPPTGPPSATSTAGSPSSSRRPSKWRSLPVVQDRRERARQRERTLGERNCPGHLLQEPARIRPTHPHGLRQRQGQLDRQTQVTRWHTKSVPPPMPSAT